MIWVVVTLAMSNLTLVVLLWAMHESHMDERHALTRAAFKANLGTGALRAYEGTSEIDQGAWQIKDVAGA